MNLELMLPLVIYLVLVLGVGFWAGRHRAGGDFVQEYFIGNRSMGGLVLALLVFGRSRYLDAYDTPSGQLFMAVALAGYAALIVRVQRLAAFPRPGRFLTARTTSGIVSSTPSQAVR